MLLNARKIEGAELILLVFHDITERKRAQDNLARKAEEFARINEELQDFAYSIAHDLQEPLRTVRSFTQLLMLRVKDKLEGDPARFAAYVEQGSERLEALLSDLRDYLEADNTNSGSEPDIDLQEILDKILTNLESSIRENGATIQIDALPKIAGHPVHLIQLFQNLIANAIKYRRPDEPPKIHISARADDSEWTFSVEDNGIGIEKEFHASIFKVFNRLHGHDYPGTGIGLAIANELWRGEAEEFGWNPSLAAGRRSSLRFHEIPRYRM